MSTAILDNPNTSLDDRDFVIQEDVPVWKEHVTRDGVRIGKRELERVAANCNARIADTDDYVPLVLRHNKDDEGGQGADDPPVVGFAGPFYVAKYGNVHPKWCIFAKRFRFFKEDAGKRKKYPRLSVEYWAPKDDPADGYFDPISLLGAETPELDLGIHYQKTSAGHRVIRYSKVFQYQASAPGGANTFIAGGADEPKKYSQGNGNMALSPEDIQQIVAGLKDTINTIVDEKFAAMNAVADPFLADPSLGAGLPGDDLGDGVVDAIADDLDDADLGDSDLEDADFGDDDLSNDDTELDSYGKLSKYAADGDDDGAKSFLESLDDDEKSEIYAKIDGEEDELKKTSLQKYMAGSNPETDEGDAMSAAEVQKYQKERDEFRTKYQKSQADLAKANAELASLKKQRAADNDRITNLERQNVRADRYQKLKALESEGIIVNPDAEIEDAVELSPEAFDKQLTRIKANYQRIGSHDLPTINAKKVTGDDKNVSKADKYSKRAVQIATQKKCSFAEALSLAMTEAGDKA